jgi:hypothetical protein
MARHDIHRLPEEELVVDEQSEAVTSRSGQVVLPLLLRADVPAPPPRLHPPVTLEDATYVVATYVISAVPGRIMGPPIGSPSSDGDALASARDALLTEW